MTEIKIQRKQKSPWPWIIGIILLAAFMWYLLNYVYAPNIKDNKTRGMDSISFLDNYSIPFDSVNEVKDFINFSKDGVKPRNPKRYTESGLIKLQSALSFLAERVDTAINSFIDKNIDSLDRAVAKADTTSANYLREIKPAFYSALKVVDSLQKLKKTISAGNISNLRDTENSINIRSTVESQLSKIKHFYEEVASTLQQMKLEQGFKNP